LSRIQQIHESLRPLKAELLDHAVYREIDRLDALQRFMAHHVFAVWDFMSLLKTLQRDLTCVEVPWLPVANSAAARLVNEIVLAEESDEDGHGGFVSHFEMYCRAMGRIEADTRPIFEFLLEIRRGQPVSVALDLSAVPESARRFVRHTFAILKSGDLAAITSAFTFGREDLLPVVFGRIVDELNRKADGGLDDFKHYLDRHIGLDGDHHGPMASRLLESICGYDPARWQIAERTAIDCLNARKRLWDGILEAIRQ
jgi:Protein of unknown function (DUF3050)